MHVIDPNATSFTALKAHTSAIYQVEAAETAAAAAKEFEPKPKKAAAPKKGKTMDALFRIKWWRIVLGAWIIRARRAMS